MAWAGKPETARQGGATAPPRTSVGFRGHVRKAEGRAPEEDGRRRPRARQAPQGCGVPETDGRCERPRAGARAAPSRAGSGRGPHGCGPRAARRTPRRGARATDKTENWGRARGARRNGAPPATLRSGERHASARSVGDALQARRAGSAWTRDTARSGRHPSIVSLDLSGSKRRVGAGN